MTCGIEATSFSHCVIDDSRIPKMPVNNLQNAFVHPLLPNSEKLTLHGLPIPNPNCSKITFLFVDGSAN
jgi:hypothetical protein